MPWQTFSKYGSGLILSCIPAGLPVEYQKLLGLSLRLFLFSFFSPDRHGLQQPFLVGRDPWPLAVYGRIGNAGPVASIMERNSLIIESIMPMLILDSQAIRARWCPGSGLRDSWSRGSA